MDEQKVEAAAQTAEADAVKARSWLDAHPKAREALIIAIVVAIVFMLGYCAAK